MRASLFFGALGLLFATVHIMGRTRQGYKALLVEDGLWYRPSSRLAVYAVLHDGGETGLGQLDTRPIDALSPKVMPA